MIELHYTPNGHATTDRTSVAMTFAKERPQKRVISLQLVRTDLDIPAGARDYHITAWGTLPNDALLLDFFPHMHLRGKAFEYDRILNDGSPEPLLRVSHYDFHWQLPYRLAKPIPLKKGTKAFRDCVVRQLREQSSESRSNGRGRMGRAELARDVSRVLRRRRGSVARPPVILHSPAIEAHSDYARDTKLLCWKKRADYSPDWSITAVNDNCDSSSGRSGSSSSGSGVPASTSRS